MDQDLVDDVFKVLRGCDVFDVKRNVLESGLARSVIKTVIEICFFSLPFEGFIHFRSDGSCDASRLRFIEEFSFDH